MEMVKGSISLKVIDKDYSKSKIMEILESLGFQPNFVSGPQAYWHARKNNNEELFEISVEFKTNSRGTTLIIEPRKIVSYEDFVSFRSRLLESRDSFLDSKTDHLKDFFVIQEIGPEPYYRTRVNMPLEKIIINGTELTPHSYPQPWPVQEYMGGLYYWYFRIFTLLNRVEALNDSEARYVSHNRAQEVCALLSFISDGAFRLWSQPRCYNTLEEAEEKLDDIVHEQQGPAPSGDMLCFNKDADLFPIKSSATESLRFVFDRMNSLSEGSREAFLNSLHLFHYGKLLQYISLSFSIAASVSAGEALIDNGYEHCPACDKRNYGFEKKYIKWFCRNTTGEQRSLLKKMATSNYGLWRSGLLHSGEFMGTELHGKVWPPFWKMTDKDDKFSQETLNFFNTVNETQLAMFYWLQEHESKDAVG